MTLVILALSILAVAAVVCVLAFAPSGRSVADTVTTSPSTAVPLRIDRQAIFDRFFGEEDVRYVRQTTHEARTIFHQERKRLALMCIAEIRDDAGKARSFHAAHARQSEQLQFSSEFSIAADFTRLVF